MQVTVHILIRLDEEMHRRLAEEGHITIDQALGRAGFVEVAVPAHSDACFTLLEALDAMGAEYTTREERQFSRKELRSAQALRIGPRVDTPPRSVAAEDYDWSESCSWCMCAPQQSGCLKADPGDLEGHAFLRGRRGEIIVGEKIALRMIAEGISGAVLREIHRDDAEHSTLRSWFQIVPIAQLPHPVSPPTRFLRADEACSRCGRGGLFLDSMLYFDVDSEALSDINVTSELFGTGSDMAPGVVVSQRFYHLLVANGARLDSEPVMFV